MAKRPLIRYKYNRDKTTKRNSTRINCETDRYYGNCIRFPADGTNAVSVVVVSSDL